MSRWTEQYENHPIHNTFEELFNYLLNPNIEPFNGDESEIRRLEKVLRILYENVKNADLELFSPTALQELESTLKSHYLPKLANYSNNPDISAYITALNNQNTLLTNPFYQKQIELPIERKDYLENAYDELANRINELNHKLENANNTIENLSIENNRLNVELQEIHNNISTTLSRWQTEFTTNENNRASEFSSAQDLRNTEFSGKQQNYSDEFKVFKNESEQNFADWQLKNNEELSVYTKNLKKKNEDVLQDIIDDSNKKHDTICQLYGIVADKSVTGGYAKVAMEEKRQFGMWRALSLSFLLFAIMWVTFSNYISNDLLSEIATLTQIMKDVKNPDVSVNDFNNIQNLVDWQSIISKFSVTFILLFGVYFCSHQATKHRDELRRAMRLELQMTALDPYIHQLKPDEQLEIKKELVSKFFIGVENFDTKEKIQTPVNLITDATFEKIKDVLPSMNKK